MSDKAQTSMKGKTINIFRIDKMYLGPFKNSIRSKLPIFCPPPHCSFLLVLDKLSPQHPSINMVILLTRVARSSNFVKDTKRNKYS